MARALEWIELPDGRHELGWWQDGLPTFPFGQVPPGLVTRRQLREAGLCPGGQGLAAQIVWRRGRAWAGLYRLDLAAPKRTPTPAQQAALARALTARRTCPTCPKPLQIKPYCLPTSTGQCWHCSLTETHDAA